MLHVFLKNKLVSADAIVPVLLEARRAGLEREIRFYLQSPKTLKALQGNAVLWKGLNELGSVVLAVPADRTFKAIFLHRLWAMVWLPSIAISLLLGRSRVIHFGQLYNSSVYLPLIQLRKGLVLVVEGAFAGFSKVQTAFAALNQKRGAGVDLSRAPNVAVFENESELAQAVRRRGNEPYVIGKPHSLVGWNEFLRQMSDSAFPPEHEEIFSCILGTFEPLDFFPEPGTAEALLRETLDVLVQHGGGRPIYIKPHAITDLDHLGRILNDYAEAPVIVTNLHPSLLAERALFTIANYYSTVLSTVHGIGGVTIEYTQYTQDALKLSGGKSMREDSVSHFIQRNKEQLKSIVSAATNAKSVRRNSSAESEMPEDLINWLKG